MPSFREELESYESSPNLPRHYQRSTDGSRRVLGRVDWHGDFLQAHADAKEDAACDKLAPGLSQGGADGS